MACNARVCKWCCYFLGEDEVGPLLNYVVRMGFGVGSLTEQTPAQGKTLRVRRLLKALKSTSPNTTL